MLTFGFEIDFQNDSELFGRTLRVNLAKPMRLRENSSRPVWADDEWLSKFSGQATLDQQVRTCPKTIFVNI